MGCSKASGNWRSVLRRGSKDLYSEVSRESGPPQNLASEEKYFAEEKRRRGPWRCGGLRKDPRCWGNYRSAPAPGMMDPQLSAFLVTGKKEGRSLRLGFCSHLLHLLAA